MPLEAFKCQIHQLFGQKTSMSEKQPPKSPEKGHLG